MDRVTPAGIRWCRRTGDWTQTSLLPPMGQFRPGARLYRAVGPSANTLSARRPGEILRCRARSKNVGTHQKTARKSPFAAVEPPWAKQPRAGCRRVYKGVDRSRNTVLVGARGIRDAQGTGLIAAAWHLLPWRRSSTPLRPTGRGRGRSLPRWGQHPAADVRDRH